MKNSVDLVIMLHTNSQYWIPTLYSSLDGLVFSRCVWSLFQGLNVCLLHRAKAGSSLNWDDTQKLKYTWQVVQECLRIQRQVEMGFRECVKEFEYKGFTIPKRWRVSWWCFKNKNLLVCFMFSKKVEALTNFMVWWMTFVLFTSISPILWNQSFQLGYWFLYVGGG
jgi:hypothetical protein